MLPSHTHHDSLQLKIVPVAIKELSESRRNVRASFHVGLEGYVCSSHIVQVPMVFQLETVTLGSRCIGICAEFSKSYQRRRTRQMDGIP